jgi:hypothetical protein
VCGPAIARNIALAWGLRTVLTPLVMNWQPKREAATKVDGKAEPKQIDDVGEEALGHD